MKPNIPSGFGILIFLQCDLARCYRILPISSLLASVSPTPTPSPPPSGASSGWDDDVSSEYEYERARKVRIKQGHDSALPLYQHLLTKYGDITAATRIAASPSSPRRHDQSCPLPEPESKPEDPSGECDEVMNSIFKIKHALEQSDYNNQGIQRIFGIKPIPDDISNLKRRLTKSESLVFAKGPVYITPVGARAESRLPSFLDGLDSGNREDASLKCLVALFLLGFAVPKNILSQHLVGGSDTIFTLEKLGLAFPCEMDPEVIIPYVHVFPLQIEVLGRRRNDEGGRIEVVENKPLILVTDCHPIILSRTTVGVKEEGAVMYIGPDSLALVQHKPIQSHMQQVLNRRMSSSSGKIDADHFQVLDFCTGSGVQALSTLKSLEIVDPGAKALCVDVNDRALRFTKFNGFLNGMDGKKVNTINADITESDPDFPNRYNILNVLNATGSPEGKPQIPIAPFDIILSNPPFIPTPQAQGDEISNIISKRYGLFSSGGGSGEDVLQAVVSISSRLLGRKDGLLAIVSEFMNPPTSNKSDRDNCVQNSELLHKLHNWWQATLGDSDAHSSIGKGKGLLFTNQLPVGASKYAARRADNENEYSSWMQNLEKQKIHCVSPGLLYIRTEGVIDLPTCQSRTDCLDIESKLVPRDNEMGSVWTPWNRDAISFTSKEWTRFAE